MPAASSYYSTYDIQIDKGLKALNKLDRAAMGLDISADTDGLNKGLAESNKRISGLSKGAKRAGQAIAVGLTAALYAGATLEADMIGVAKTTGLASDEVKNLKDELLDFSTKNAVTISSLGEISKVAGQLKIKGAADIAKF